MLPRAARIPHHKNCCETSLHTMGHCIDIYQKRLRPCVNMWSFHRPSRLSHRMWTSTPLTSSRIVIQGIDASPPEPGRPGFHPPNTFRGRTGALIRGIPLCQMPPVSEDSCLGSMARLSRRKFDCFPRLFAVYLTDSLNKFRATQSPEFKPLAARSCLGRCILSHDEFQDFDNALKLECCYWALCNTPANTFPFSRITFNSISVAGRCLDRT